LAGRFAFVFKIVAPDVLMGGYPAKRVDVSIAVKYSHRLEKFAISPRPRVVIAGGGVFDLLL